MITENGTIKVETRLDENVQKEFMAKTFIVSLVCLILGSVGIVAYLTWDILSEFIAIKAPSIVILIVFACAFAFGLVFVISRNKLVKKARTENKTEVYEFFNNYVVANDYLNGEQVATVKIYYNQIIKRKETKNYIFFFVQTAAACPVSKAGLTDGELNAIRALLGTGISGGAAMRLPDGSDGNDEKAVKETPKDEPFDELKGTEDKTEEQ